MVPRVCVQHFPSFLYFSLSRSSLPWPPFQGTTVILAKLDGFQKRATRLKLPAEVGKKLAEITDVFKGKIIDQPRQYETDIEFQPETCCALITELQSRIQGYELTEYVKAMTHAIQSCYSISKDEK